MESLKGLTIDAFLPLGRMQEPAGPGRVSYSNAEPYPHVVFDNFFDPRILDLVLEEFPKPGQIRWQKFDNGQEIKLASAAEASFGPATRLLLYHLNSVTFLQFLSEVTGIEHLIASAASEGGGLQQIVRGGKVSTHADSN